MTPALPAATLDPKQQTQDFLKTWEGGWIVDLLQRPVLIWGAQGSYKSYFAAYLALLRHYLKGHALEINDPHLELNKHKAWKSLIAIGVPAVGSKFDYLAIAGRIEAFLGRIQASTKDKPWVSPIFDEVSQYAFKEDIKSVSASLLLACLADCRKAHEAPILLAHNNTQTLLGGAKGVKQAMDEGLVQLHLLSTSLNGEYSPLFRGELTGLPNARGELTLRVITLDASRMHPEYLIKLFERNLTASQALGEPLRTIWQYCKEQGGWITTRELLRKDFKTLKSADTAQIKEYFYILKKMQYGEIDESGTSVKFQVF